MYEIFEQLLSKYGITAYKVAKETGITTATLSNWKQGKYTPKQDKLQKIADYFGVVASSAELGVAKPDPKIFRLALAMAECEPSQAVMIGDRIDNDVVPAKQYGMWTVWVRSGLSAYQPKDLAGAHADFVIDELTALQALF